jgi:arylsulfatase A-like enzyme
MDKPNVLFVIVDQWNYRCLGYKGHPVVETPNLDSLKSDSVEFSRCYVQNAFCLPSRISYLSSQYLFTHRQYGFHGLMDEETPSMPQFFMEQGYETIHIGKAHVNPLIDQLGFKTFIPTIPEDIPFSTDIEDNYQAFSQQQGYMYPHDQVHGGAGMVPVKSAVVHDRQRGVLRSAGVSEIPSEDSVETYVSTKAIEFLHREHSLPFFLHVSFDRPHPPLSPSAPYASYYDPDEIPLPKAYTEEEMIHLPPHIRNRFEAGYDALPALGEANMRRLLAHYYGLMTHIDREIGKIVEALVSSGQYQDTIIVFCADHGDFAGYKGMFNKYSNTIYHDVIIRTPLLIKLPDQAYAGKKVDHLTEAVDLFPTLSSICGLDSSVLPLEGRDLMALVEGSSSRDKDGRWREVAFSESYSIKTLVKGDSKLIYHVNSPHGELYNLSEDPEERWNLYNDPVWHDKAVELKLEIVKKMTKRPSETRKSFIRSLFDDSRGQAIHAMDKLYKWDKSIVDGGGFWTVWRDGHRLTYIPFDDDLRFEIVDPDLAIPAETLGLVPCDDQGKMEAMLDELLNYIATTIRPISLMSGGQHSFDNMLQTKGPGFC